MILFNQGQRTITGKTSAGEPYEIKPRTALNFKDDNDAKYMQGLFPKELLSMDDVTKNFDKATVDAPVAGLPADLPQSPAPVEEKAVSVVEAAPVEVKSESVISKFMDKITG